MKGSEDNSFMGVINVDNISESDLILQGKFIDLIE